MNTSYAPLILLLSALLFAATGCPSPTQGNCSPSCPTGYECSATGVCLPSPLPLFRGSDVPGNQLRLAFLDQRLITASVEPTTGFVILGEGGRSESFSFVEVNPSGLVEPVAGEKPQSGSPIALAATPQYAFVVWLADDSHFRLGIKKGEDEPGRWAFQKVELPKGENYRATSDFTVVVTPTGKLFIAYRDTEGDFQSLEHVVDLTKGFWEKELIARRKEVELTPGCIRDVSGRGKGISGRPSSVADPSSTSSENLYISHYDADCGSLLISERKNGVWETKLVDPGSRLSVPAYKMEMTQVGSMSSVAVTKKGRVGIAYNDQTLGKLKYASRTQNGAWRPMIVDHGEAITPDSTVSLARVGSFPSLSYSEGSQPVITYQDATNHTIRSATVRGGIGVWGFHSVDTKGFIGFFQSHAYKEGVGRVVGTDVLERRSSEDGGGYRSRLRLIWSDD